MVIRTPQLNPNNYSHVCHVHEDDSPVRETVLSSSVGHMRKPRHRRQHRMQSKSEIRLDGLQGYALCSVYSPHALLPQTMGRTFHIVYYPAGTGF